MIPALTWTRSEMADSNTELRALRTVNGLVLDKSGTAASETALREAQGPMVLHVRTHGAYLARQKAVPASDRSILLLGRDAAHDGFLLASEVRFLRLDGTRLVTLAACETGKGQSQRSEPLGGFRRAFHLAGSRTVLAPLWLVPSDATAKLLADVYQSPKLPLWRTLGEAQRKLRNAGKPASAWASWVLSGDPSPLI